MALLLGMVGYFAFFDKPQPTKRKENEANPAVGAPNTKPLR